MDAPGLDLAWHRGGWDKYRLFFLIERKTHMTSCTHKFFEIHCAGAVTQFSPQNTLAAKQSHHDQKIGQIEWMHFFDFTIDNAMGNMGQLLKKAQSDQPSSEPRALLGGGVVVASSPVTSTTTSSECKIISVAIFGPIINRKGPVHKNCHSPN